MDESRKQFEAWFNDHSNWKITSGMRRNGGYIGNPSAQQKWECWQASRESIEIEFPDVEKWRSVDSVRAQNAYKIITTKAIESAGLKVKK